MEVEHNFFDVGDSENAFNHFKALVRCRDITDVPICTLKLVQLVQLGNLEKGALSSSASFQSRNDRWFSQKKKKMVSVGDKGSDDAVAENYIQRDSLVQIYCKHGKSISVGNYRVLAFFSKYYNKWYVAGEKKCPWPQDPSCDKVLVRLMKKVEAVIKR